MKFASTILFAAAAAVASVSAAEDCTAAQSATTFTALTPLLSEPYLPACATDSGFDMLNTQTLPTDAMYAKMCKLDTCKKLIAAVVATKPPQCVLLIPTSQAKLNVYELVTGFDAKCASVAGGAADSSNSTSSSNSTGSSNSTTKAPSTTTKAPTTVTSAPSTATTAPTPAPTSAASTSVLAASVAAVAVAAFASA